mmetsp:Transcript_24327/g.52339  ORF Transcript_24327/g.52339 Transcript_24327/m.52339 type:complete len:302 (-) Transcript_24327:1274-2179(-)
MVVDSLVRRYNTLLIGLRALHVFPNVTARRGTLVVRPRERVALDQLLPILAPPVAVVNLIRLGLSLDHQPGVFGLVLLPPVVRGRLLARSGALLLLRLLRRRLRLRGLLLLRGRRCAMRTGAWHPRRAAPVGRDPVAVVSARVRPVRRSSSGRRRRGGSPVRSPILHVGKRVVLGVVGRMVLVVRASVGAAAVHLLLLAATGRRGPVPGEPRGWVHALRPVLGLRMLLRLHEVRVGQPRRRRELSHESGQEDGRVELVRRRGDRAEGVREERGRASQRAQRLEHPLLLRLEVPVRTHVLPW